MKRLLESVHPERSAAQSRGRSSRDPRILLPVGVAVSEQRSAAPRRSSGQAPSRGRPSALLLALTLAAIKAEAGTFHPASEPERAVAGRWMVLLAKDASSAPVAAQARALVGAKGRVERTWTDALRGFIAVLPAEDAKGLAADARVAGVYQDLVLEQPFSAPGPDCSQGVTLSGPLPSPPTPETLTCADPNPQNAAATCTDNWGLDRLDGASPTRNGLYTPPRSGQGVHVFLVDSGLYAQHQEFTGRVGLGTDATGGGGTPDDCSSWSHGTHVAGIAAGTRFGVAKGATLHMVRIAPCPVSIQLSSLVTAFDWIAQAHATTVTGPAVASMSLNSASAEFLDPAQPLGVAVAGVLAAGVLVINSSGNQAGDACAHALRVPGVLIVGGSDEFDTPWERVPGDPNYAAWCGTDCGSNNGACVDLYAPAAHIVSSWFGTAPDPTNSCRLSGTSMAAPHVAGAAALYLQANPSATPAQVKQDLLARALPALSQLPAGSPNRLATVLEGAPGIGLSPTGTVAFGAVGVGVTSSAQRVTVTSTGTRALQVGLAALGGAMASEFRVATDGCSNRALQPAATCAIDLTFTPVAGGARAASLAVPSDDPLRPVLNVPLTGQGDQPTVSVQKAGAGSGTVTSAPAGIACGATCSAGFPPGTAVVLTPQPAPGSTFAGWAGFTGCFGATCAFTVTVSSQATATFALAPPDSGSPDAGPPDAGAQDAGSSADGGAAPQVQPGGGPGLDAGAPGAGPPVVGVRAEGGGCGCQAGGAAFVWAGLVALAVRRRRGSPG